MTFTKMTIGLVDTVRNLKLWMMMTALYLLISMGQCAGTEKIPIAPPPESMPDASDLVPWPEKAYPVYAPGSVANVNEWLFDAPAGKHGSVKSLPDGQLVFEDNTPARFWGTTTTYGVTFPEKPEEVAKLADAIANMGFNLVRFHHNDVGWNSIGYLQQKPMSNYLLDPNGMKRFDMLAAELIKRGVYLYLDFADYRVFLAEDDFEGYEELNKLGNYGWKGVFPHPKIVAAWKRAVTEFLNHKNPYTGRTYAEEPAVVTIEIINENGPFWDWSFKINDKVQKWHDQQWNDWLLKKYGTVEKMDATWTDLDGTKGLFEGEDPAKNTVFRPRLVPLLEWDRSYRSKTRGAARVNDYYTHLADTAISFYSDATKHIRDLGFKGVVIGSHELQGAIDQYSEIKGAGSIAAHLYAPGMPAWNARPNVSGATMDGVDVKTKNWFSNLPRIKSYGVPGINGEWNGGGLTYRADANVAVAAITSFQQVTQSLEFGFASRWGGEQMDNFDNRYKYLGYLGKISNNLSNIHDAAWMATNRICAPLFIRRDFAVPKSTVQIAFSEEDRCEQNLHASGINGGSFTIGNAALFLPNLHNVETYFFDKVYDGNADVVFTTGRSASGDYSKAKHAVIIGDNPYTDRYHKGRDIGAPAKLVNPAVKLTNLKVPTTFTFTWPYTEKKEIIFDTLEGAVELSSIPKGAQSIGISADKKYTLGWLDDKYLVLPNARAFHNRASDIQWLYRMYLSACSRWKVPIADNAAGITYYRSDTKEFTVDWGTGTLLIDTPKTQGASGMMGWRKENITQDMSCTIDVPYGNVLVTSADNKPIRSSNRMLLTATGRVQNTGQIMGKDKDGFTMFTNIGKAPILAEALRGQVTLTSDFASTLIVYALDSEGRRMGKVDTTNEKGKLTFKLTPKWGTILFEISTPEIKGPEVTVANGAVAPVWPLPELERTAAPSPPNLVTLEEFFDSANKGKGSKTTTTNAEPDKNPRFTAKKIVANAFNSCYGNAKQEVFPDLTTDYAMKVQFGKINREWFGGFWTSLNAPSISKPEECLGYSITFKGDGTLPREAYIVLKTSTGLAYTTKNINTIFESDAWKDIRFTAADFKPDAGTLKKNPDAPAVIDWSTVNRMDFSCVGPLMDVMSVGQFRGFYFDLAPIDTTTPKVVTPNTSKSTRFDAKKFTANSVNPTYGNAKGEAVPDLTTDFALKVQFGKINREWYGGFFTSIDAPAGLKPEEILGIGLSFKGDGTLPRDAYFTLTTAAGIKYGTKNINTVFENDQWKDIIYKATDFKIDGESAKKNPAAPINPDLSTINRIDFNCVGPLMDTVSVGQFRGIYFEIIKAQESAAPAKDTDKLIAALPVSILPETPSLTIPYIAGAKIVTDGIPDEAIWAKSAALSMNELKVPKWHFFGSHIVEGKRTNGEGSDFWLLATDDGLALLSSVKTGRGDIIADKSDWFTCDCVEIFTDVNNANGKPTKQIFLAYKRPALDRPSASDSSIKIGRSLINNGYVLETLLPWKAMGFAEMPTGEFGFEFQVDYAQAGLGRVLQMAYGTGTNEAWIRADHYMKMKIAK
jgi:hypothetical protein